MNKKQEKDVFDYIDGTKFIKVQAAYEREFENEKLIVLNAEGVKEERILNGIIYEADAFGISGGVYTVYFANANFVTPYLVVDQMNNHDVTNKVKIVSLEAAEPVKMYSNCDKTENVNLINEESNIAAFYEKGGQ